MPEPIISIERIKQQAREAAEEYDCVNNACPYSFYTPAGRLFKQEFQKARMEINMRQLMRPAKGAAP